MMTKGLEKFESGNVILVAPVGKIKEYKEKQQATEQVVEQLEPLVTEYIRINYARAENFRNLLNGLDTGAFGTCGSSKDFILGSSSGSSGSSSSSASSGGLATQGSARRQTSDPVQAKQDSWKYRKMNEVQDIVASAALLW